VNFSTKSVLVIGCILASITANQFRIGAKAETTNVQDTFGLDRRIAYLEQRLNTIEASINRLDRQPSPSQRTAPSTCQCEEQVGLLQNQIAITQARMRGIECGLARIDERTLSTAARQARDRAGRGSADRCRLDVERPLVLSTEP
jgi:hypothetical protein